MVIFCMSVHSFIKVFSFTFDTAPDLFYCVCFQKDFEKLGPQIVNDFCAFKGVESSVYEAAESFVFSLQCSNRHKDYLLVRELLSGEVLCVSSDCGVVRFPDQIAS